MFLKFYQSWILRDATDKNPRINIFGFSDPSVEEKYFLEYKASKLVVTRLHTLFFSGWSLAVVIGSLLVPNLNKSLPHSDFFWSVCSGCILSCVFFILTFVQKIQNRIDGWHGCYCILMNVLLVWMMLLEGKHVMDEINGVASPSLTNKKEKHLITTMLGGMVSVMCQCVYITIARNQLIASAIMGFSRYTIPSMLSWPIAFFVTWGLSPYNKAFVVIPAIIEQVGSILASLIFSIWMEQYRRSTFLKKFLKEQEVKKSKACDIILNQTLKDILSDAAGNIELFLSGDLGSQNSPLSDGLFALRRGIRSCKSRQTCLKLLSQTYVPTFSPVNLVELGEQLVKGRPVQGNFPDKRVMLDVTLCNLIFETGINNAFRHGCPADPNVRFTIEATPALNLSNHLRLAFHVRNRADPSSECLTAEFVERVFAGSHEHQDEPQADLPAPAASTSLVPIGLFHCRRAADVLDMDLSMTQNADEVCLTGFLTIKSPSVAPLSSPQAESREPALPVGLSYFLLDDSKASLLLMTSWLSHGASSRQIRTFGQVEEDVAVFVEEALRDADVVICDQHLQYTHNSYKGSDIVGELQHNSFSGLLCIRSADMEPTDISFYRSKGAHCTLGKDLSKREFLHSLGAAFVVHTGIEEADLVLPCAVDV